MARIGMLSLAVSLLLVALARGDASFSGEVSDAEAGKNPIRRIVTLLQNMAKKVGAEGEAEEALYSKFACYCKNGQADLTAAIVASDAKVPALQSEIEEAEAEVKRLKHELATAQEDRSTAKAAIQSATSQREKENAKFVEVSTEYKGYIGSLNKAIPAIEKGMAGGFLQTASGSSLQRALSADSSVTDYDRQLVISFLSGRTDEEYVPKSGEITGILKTIKEDFEKNLKEVETEESSQQKSFEELIGAKNKQVQVLSAAIETKTEKVGNLEVSIVTKKSELGDSEAALIADQKFKADLDGDCAAKTAEWDERKKLRAEELVTIHETIKILNDDDSLDLFKQTLSSPSLLQMEGDRNVLRKKALASIHGIKKSVRSAPGLDFLALALSGKAVDFTNVIKMIDNMVTELAREQITDDDKKEYCNQKIDAAEDKGKELTREIEYLKTSITETDGNIEGFTADVKELEKGVAELDASVQTAGEDRKKENDEYKSLIATNNAAKQLLDKAKNRLNKFYNPALHTTNAPAQLSEEDQIVQNLGGASLVQISQHRREDPGPRPDTWSEYKNKGEETTGVIHLLDMLAKELDTEITEAEVDEKNSQKEYEQMMSDSAKKRAQDVKAIATKNAALANEEQEKVKASENLKAQQTDLKSTKTEEMNLHKECDWLLQNFDLRKSARAQEVDQLKTAKAVLAGADVSLLQGHSSGAAKALRR